MYFMYFDASPFGVVTRAEARARGVSDRELARQVRVGALVRHRPGVLLRQPPPPQAFDRWLQRAAAELAAAGPGAVLGGQAAAALWRFDGFDDFEFTDGATDTPPLVIVVPPGSGRRGPPRRRLAPVEPPGLRHGLPVTGAAETLLDLGYDLAACERRRAEGAVAGPDALDRVELAVESALRRRLVREDELLAMARQAAPQRRGRHVLRLVLERRPVGAPATGSYLETRGIQVLRAGGIPDGIRQAAIVERGVVVARVDLLLAGRVVVEFDGRAHHDRTPADMVRDRRRWTRLTALGLLIAVFTTEDVERYPATVVEEVRRLLHLAAG